MAVHPPCRPSDAYRPSGLECGESKHSSLDALVGIENVPGLALPTIRDQSFADSTSFSFALLLRGCSRVFVDGLLDGEEVIEMAVTYSST